MSTLYAAGVAVVLAFRIAAARRVHQEMPRVEGILRPRVVIPKGLDPACVAMARAHEEAHIRRRDPMWSFVADLVCAGLWFAPPVWLCARGMRAEAEVACDAAALQETGASHKAYARLLLAYTGSAPANALGGPARRLSRRILMLEWNGKPLSHPLAGGLVALGLTALPPWQAVAQASVRRDTPPMHSSAGFSHGLTEKVPAIWMPLKRAAKLLLEEPGIKERVGWTAAQDAAVEAGAARWQKVWNAFAAELYARHKTMPLREVFAWDASHRRKALARANMASEPYPWTPQQERTLESLALGQFGSGLWEDPEIDARLHLTSAQRRAIHRENGAIRAAYVAMVSRTHSVLRYGKPMPNRVKQEIAALERRYLDAPTASRQALNLQIATLQNRYKASYGQDLARGSKEENRTLDRTWAMRANADYRLNRLLTDTQRTTLRTLVTEPSAWSRQYAYYGQGRAVTPQGGVRLGINRSGLRLENAGAGIAAAEGTRDDAHSHSGHKPVVYDSVMAELPSFSEASQTLPKTPVRSIRFPHMEASAVDRSGGKIFLSADGTFEGHRLDHFDYSQGSLLPITLASSEDGSVWNVYREGTRPPYRYRVERIVGMTSPPIKHTLVPKDPSHPTPRLLSRWSGLIIDGPPPGDEPGNVPIGVAHDPDGSTWTVYRSRQSAPYTYAVEHSTTAPPRLRKPAKMLEYDRIEHAAILREDRDLRRRNPLPSSLTVDGKVWAIHVPGWLRQRTSSAGGSPKPLPWTEASIRRALHLQDGETLDFWPDPDHLGDEVARLADREGILTENVVYRHHEADGTVTYRVQSIVRHNLTNPKP